jgi:hypothetical protein
MEISSAEATSVSLYSDPEDPGYKSTWYKRGSAATLAAFSAIGAAAVWSSRKKRSVAVISPGAPAIDLPVPEAPEPRPPTAGQGAGAESGLDPVRLPFKESDREKIDRVISALGTKNIFALGYMQGELNGLKSDIDYLHPFRFLALIFKNPISKRHMRTVIDATFIGSRFTKEIGDNMAREEARANVEPHIEAFSRELKVPLSGVKPLILEKRWEELVRFLVEKSALPEG